MEQNCNRWIARFPHHLSNTQCVNVDVLKRRLILYIYCIFFYLLWTFIQVWGRFLRHFIHACSRASFVCGLSHQAVVEWAHKCGPIAVRLRIVFTHIHNMDLSFHARIKHHLCCDCDSYCSDHSGCIISFMVTKSVRMYALVSVL